MTRAPALARLAAAVLAAALALGLVAAAAAAALAAITHRADVRPAYAQDGPLVILAIGSDIGMPYRSGDPLRGRADGVHLIAVDTAEHKATIVSIPRDSLVAGNKVNAGLAFGGPDRLVANLEAYTGVDIHYWALTTFRGIEEMTRGMGGVEIEIERRMNDPFSGSHFEPGVMRLQSEGALAFLRDRKTFPDGDFSRARNHGRFMAAAHRDLVASQSDLRTLVHRAALFARTTVSNIPQEDLLPLALLALRIDPGDVRLEPLSGGFGTTGGGASIVHLRPGDAFDRIKAGQIGPPGQG
jgi:LCP family protein required for cell wall assembly